MNPATDALDSALATGPPGRYYVTRSTGVALSPERLEAEGFNVHHVRLEHSATACLA